MTIKEAVLKSLEELNSISNHTVVCDYMIKNGLYNFSTALTPSATVSAALGDFIRKSDSRVKRIKEKNGSYSYYLAKNEQNIELETISQIIEVESKKIYKIKSYDERDLHRLLCSYLKNTGVYSKTIYHEQSTFGKDNNQIWTHPDMVGIRFLNLQTKASQNFLKSINRVDTFKLSSYELKKEINSDSELKKAFFQAVSNSSWANYGYLVAFE
ncbi:MAG: hypothetical protein WCJ61_17960, partial [Paludibacter sp.]